MRVVDTDDMLVQMALAAWCKANYGYDEQAERYQQVYEQLRAKLAVACDYAWSRLTFTVYASTTASPLEDATILLGDEVPVVLTTNSYGQAEHYTTVWHDDVEWTVYADGYATTTGSVYVDGHESVAVVLT